MGDMAEPAFELTDADRLEAVRIATASFRKSGERWKKRAASGLTDAELEKALRDELGVAGARGGPNQLWVAYRGYDLLIGASWEGPCEYRLHSLDPKVVVCRGKETIRLARQVWGVDLPITVGHQFSLFQALAPHSRQRERQRRQTPRSAAQHWQQDELVL